MILARQWRFLVPLAARGRTAKGVDPPAGKVEFDLVSVRPSQSNNLQTSSAFPLAPGSAYVPNGGYFSALNYPVATYIAFAYDVMGVQQDSLMSQLPGWALTDRFDIQARTDGNPAKDTKDQMRLMMQSLLADRFKLALHFETRQGSVFGLTALKPGKTGPLLQAHPNDSSCATVSSPPPNQLAGQFPARCESLAGMPASAPGLVRFGARNVTMEFIANMLVSMGSLDRPILDQTGLAGTFDFALEYVFQRPGANLQADLPGISFMDAVREQLGLKLESQKGPATVLVLDHVGARLPKTKLTEREMTRKKATLRTTISVSAG